jgi:hydrogenase maturation protease
MRSETEPLLIIGYGNLLRGDDAVGRYAARELQRHGFPAIEADQLTPELAENLSRVEQAIFIDSDATLRPGEVRAMPLRPRDAAALEHSSDPGALLNFTRAVYGRAPSGVLIGIGAETYEFGHELSAAAAAAMDDVLASFFAPGP